MKPYTQYKPTNIPWIEDIPEHWKLKKIKYISYVKARVGWKGLTSSDFEVNSDAILITGTDFKGRLINWDSCFQVNRYWYENDPFIQLRENDLLITKDGTIGKIALVNNLPKDATLNSGVFVLRPIKNYFTNEFMYWILSSSIFTNFIKFIKTGSTINHLYQDVLENFQIPLPDLVEQTKIVEYLDIKTKQIDDLILYKENLIDLLEEERICAINQAVTKGLNPNAQTKDSGIEWIGKIPEGWEVKKLKYISKLKSGDSIPTDLIKAEGTYPVYGGNDIRGYYDNFSLEGDYVLIGRQGALCGNINFAKGKFWASEHAIVNSLKKGNNYIWLGELLRAMNLNQYSQSAAQPGLSVEKIANLLIPVPPKDEQRQIAEVIIKKNNQIYNSIFKINKEIELLQEYRMALISEAVTGKIDVREYI